jgi:cardiolipin synthase
MARPLQIKPLAISKINTFAQLGFAALVLSTSAFRIDIGPLEDVGMAVVALLTVISAGAYVRLWLRHMGDK